MERIPVSSSSLRSIGYEPASLTLEVEFNNGRMYQYADVPQSEFEALLSAESVGRYFNTNIKDRYQWVQL